MVKSLASFVMLVLVLFLNGQLVYADQGGSLAPPPPVDEAFKLSISQTSPTQVTAVWQILPGYHLFKNKIQFHTLPESSYQLGKVTLPPGISQYDDILGHYQLYEKSVQVILPLTKISNTDHLILKVDYQGCRGVLYCYPPVTKTVNMALNANAVTNVVDGQMMQQPYFSALFAHRSTVWILLSFMGFGILLSFTPCVLPMIPILSSIILGQKKVSTLQSFTLSLIYIVSAAIAFAIAGFVTAKLGHSVQAMLQNKWMIIAAALIFAILALSLFGLFELQLPKLFRNKIDGLSRKQKSGTYIGAAIMGILSSLVASPCISAPLVGALVYISTTGNAFLGASALFTMGMGIGLPLLAVGTFGGKLFIKAGPWMKWVKIFFGIIMAALACWMLSRLWPQDQYITKENGFIVAYNMMQLQDELNNAKKQNKPVIIDFYATWCTACKELEYKTFQDKAVLTKLKNFVLIRAEVTANDRNTAAMEKSFSVFAPPAVIFLNSKGAVVKPATLYGYVSSATFIKSIAMSQ